MPRYAYTAPAGYEYFQEGALDGMPQRASTYPTPGNGYTQGWVPSAFDPSLQQTSHTSKGPPYLCKCCRKSFRQDRSRKRHEDTKSQDKGTQCPDCDHEATRLGTFAHCNSTPQLATQTVVTPLWISFSNFV
jgi:hypothetical protein